MTNFNNNVSTERKNSHEFKKQNDADIYRSRTTEKDGQIILKSANGEKFLGNVKILTNGVGFMENHEVSNFAMKDAFIDKRDVTRLALKPGDLVKAHVRLNGGDKPQAFDVEIMEACEEQLGLLGGPSVPNKALRFLGTHQGAMKLLPNGVGFIRNQVIQATQRRDIYVDRRDVEYHQLKHGDILKCKVYVNYEKKPQAYNIEVVKEAAPEKTYSSSPTASTHTLEQTGQHISSPQEMYPSAYEGGHQLSYQQQDQVQLAQQQLFQAVTMATPHGIPVNRPLTQEEAFYFARQQLQSRPNKTIQEANMLAVIEAYAQLAAQQQQAQQAQHIAQQQQQAYVVAQHAVMAQQQHAAHSLDRVETSPSGSPVISSTELHGNYENYEVLASSPYVEEQTSILGSGPHVGSEAVEQNAAAVQELKNTYYGSAAGTSMPAANDSSFGDIVLWEQWTMASEQKSGNEDFSFQL